MAQIKIVGGNKKEQWRFEKKMAAGGGKDGNGGRDSRERQWTGGGSATIAVASSLMNKINFRTTKKGGPLILQ